MHEQSRKWFFKCGQGITLGSLFFLFLMRFIFGFGPAQVRDFYFVYTTVGSLGAGVGMIFLIANLPTLPISFKLGSKSE